MSELSSVFTNFGTDNSNLSLLTGVIDMDSVEDDIQGDDVATYFYSRDYVRVRIPTIHGLNPNSSWYKDITDEGVRKSVAAITVDRSALPWAKLMAQVSFTGALQSTATGKEIRDALGIVNSTSEVVYLLSFGGDLSQLIVVGRPAAVSNNETINNSRRSSSTTSTAAVSNIVDYTELVNDGKYRRPCPEGQSGYFGEVTGYTSSNGPYHAGIDIAGGSSNPYVYPIVSGVVYGVYAGNVGGFGNLVVVEHSITYKTKKYYFYSLYGHLLDDSVAVTSGTQVNKNTVLGRRGATGGSYAEHLHLGVLSTTSGGKLSGTTGIHGYMPSNNTVSSGYQIRSDESIVYYSPSRLIKSGRSELISLMKLAGVIS